MWPFKRKNMIIRTEAEIEIARQEREKQLAVPPTLDDLYNGLLLTMQKFRIQGVLRGDGSITYSPFYYDGNRWERCCWSTTEENKKLNIAGRHMCFNHFDEAMIHLKTLMLEKLSSRYVKEFTIPSLALRDNFNDMASQLGDNENRKKFVEGCINEMCCSMEAGEAFVAAWKSQDLTQGEDDVTT